MKGLKHILTLSAAAVLVFGIGIDRKIENLFFQTYMQIPDVDSEPDSDSDPRCAPTINVRLNGGAFQGRTARGRGFSWN
ncbi:MAG: hypothetical protein JXR49_19750 [Acidobacteria bacterium]|nr:hypothetical protein [Acidobacteriota bacterium]